MTSTAHSLSRRIRAQRGPKVPVDPWGLPPWSIESERWGDGAVVATLTVFLVGSECPFTCVFCDLWRHTLDGPTPVGALPAQLRQVHEAVGSRLGALRQVKLYNASNFFDDRAVPPADDATLVDLVAPFGRVVVENHPRLTGARCEHFARTLAAAGGELQVAMGLETIHPGALPRLNKQLTLDTFARAAATLRRAGIGLRAFVLVGAPFVPGEEAVMWATRSAAFAFAQGAVHVALIPMRGTAGALADPSSAAPLALPTLGQAEDALDACLAAAPPDGVVTLDTWDLGPLATCPTCAEGRLARIEQINLSGRPAPRVTCTGCDGG